MKKNYEAWGVDASSFPRNGTDAHKLMFLCRYGVLAPSGHNSQPWELHMQGDILVLSIDQEGYLSAEGSGLLSAEPHVSLGCFLGTIDLAAKGFGLKLAIDVMGEPNNYAHIQIMGSQKKQPALLDAIRSRSSDRNDFSRKDIDAQVLAEIVSQTPKNVEVHRVTEPDIELVANKTKEALDIIMSEPKYRQELSHWVRANTTNSYKGMPGFTHGVPMLPSFFGKWIVRHMPGQGPQGDKSRRMILNSGAILVVGTKDRSLQSLVNAGIAYSKICTLAALNGVASSALGAAVIEPSIKEQTTSLLKLNFEPTYILRLGYSTTETRHSPRKRVENTKLAMNS